MGSVTPQHEEYPPRASLLKDVYRPFPIVPSWVPKPDAPDHVAQKALKSLTEALQPEQPYSSKLKSCFLDTQAYWRDILALSYHVRTFKDSTIPAAMIKLKKQRGLVSGFEMVPGSANYVEVSPKLRWVDCMFTFSTVSPAAKCGGRMMLLPEIKDGQIELSNDSVQWKIWSLATWLDGFDSHPEDIDGLTAPGRQLDDLDTIETDVFIIGGGNAGIILSTRLKALGIESIVLDRNPRPGDNWALRYDCLKFHIARSNCETPYLPYRKDLPMLLNREQLAEHMRRYASAFNLNLLNSAKVESTSYDQANKVWTLQIQTLVGPKTVKCRHLVQATGIGSSKPFIPQIENESLYKGISIHSVQYKNGKQLINHGCKSVLVIGSANTAFDVMEDCANANLATTMVARSPTFLFPWDYTLHPAALGLYEKISVETADAIQMTSPAAIGGQLVKGLFASLAAQQPDLYKPLADAGFPVIDARDAMGDLSHHLMERGGGHFNDIGDGIKYIVDGRVKVKGNVSPVAYTETGLRFSDGSTVDADAIVWCTGFADRNAKAVTAEILGGKYSLGNSNGNAVILGPEDVAARMDGVWGVDADGELRGVFKRHLRAENFWTMGGATTHHRYYSKVLALQIHAAVKGFLPEAYRDTPEAL